MRVLALWMVVGLIVTWILFSFTEDGDCEDRRRWVWAYEECDRRANCTLSRSDLYLMRQDRDYIQKHCTGD